MLTLIAGVSAYASELKIKDLTVGAGELVENEKQVVVHYTGWLLNGKKFDSSHDRNRPFSFTVGARQVIPGWETGVLGMKVGGKRELIIPPEMAYGARGVGDVIPPDSTLRFEIELLGVKEAPLKNIDNAGLKALLQKGVKVIDIRTPAEWQQTGVVEGSRLLPFRMANGKINRNFPTELAKLVQPDEDIILICRSGNRSSAAGQLLTQRFGYSKVYNVRKGMNLWLSEGNTTVQPHEDDVKKHQ
ncbi:MAG: FKBP-type peptidyl-prolyl cis-trans isomerase [Terasakiella sp.]|uniref:FKBP-type peptidyl-prolyl cis-trans isomerase n=1 Tax=unclassified Terasakiella TaxID=2614952 RepID=UPI003AFFDAD4